VGMGVQTRPHSSPGSAAAVLTSALEVRLGRHFAVRLAEIGAVKVVTASGPVTAGRRLSLSRLTLIGPTQLGFPP